MPPAAPEPMSKTPSGEAERQMNTDLAREGCQKAIRQWELDEKAIRRAPF
jgi:hypothetical protein